MEIFLTKSFVLKTQKALIMLIHRVIVGVHFCTWLRTLLKNQQEKKRISILHFSKINANKAYSSKDSIRLSLLFNSCPQTTHFDFNYKTSFPIRV